MFARMGQSESKHGGAAAAAAAAAAGRGGEEAWRGVEMKADDTERMVVWEVCIARACLDNFHRMLMVLAIIFTLLAVACFVAFLEQLHDSSGESKALLIFSLANSIALYTATAGVLFSIYCLLAAVISFHDVPLPSRFNDPLSLDLLHNLRTYLRHIALPAIKRRCKFLFSNLAFCLLFCVIAHMSAGIASIDAKDRLIGVILPAIPGCFILLFLVLLGASKLHLELDFDKRFTKLWAAMAPHIIDPPEVCPFNKATTHALDPLPSFLSWIRADD